jgi:hypothetical protein
MTTAARLVLLACVCGFIPAGVAELAVEATRLEEKDAPPRLELRFRLNEPDAVESVEASAGGKKLAVQFTSFAESAGHSIVVLFLVDTSDPKRARTVEAAKALLGRIAERADAHTKLAVYSFSADLAPVVEFGAPGEEWPEKIAKLKATGLATEMYRVTIEAIKVLEGADAARKALVLLSDGRAEDTTFSLEQAVGRARQAGVAIFALGYAESPQGTIHLQSLRRLAAETGGAFAEADIATRREPENFAHDLFATLESGGLAAASLDGVKAGETVEFEIRTKTQRSVRCTHTLGEGAPAAPASHRRTWLIAGLGAALLLAAAALGLTRRHAAPGQIFARLKLLDSDGTEHAMRTTALRVGRGADNDLTLRNDSISRHHAEIHRTRDGTFTITDLGAGNGVLVNGEKVERATLKHEDLIELGEVRLRFLIA